MMDGKTQRMVAPLMRKVGYRGWAQNYDFVPRNKIVDVAAAVAPEVGQGLHVGVEERRELLVAVEGDEEHPGVAEDHGEAVDQGEDPGDRHPVGAPVDLSLEPRRRLEAAEDLPGGLPGSAALPQKLLEDC